MPSDNEIIGNNLQNISFRLNGLCREYFFNLVVEWYFMRSVWAAVVLAKLFSWRKKIDINVKI
ncbi:MAG: hypothetical protein LBL39_07470 [Planctomycetaceae bacterium]|nr:hypothetical protein [Planctomycetaceae bacterium]